MCCKIMHKKNLKSSPSNIIVCFFLTVQCPVWRPLALWRGRTLYHLTISSSHHQTVPVRLWTPRLANLSPPPSPLPLYRGGPRLYLTPPSGKVCAHIFINLCIILYDRNSHSCVHVPLLWIFLGVKIDANAQISLFLTINSYMYVYTEHCDRTCIIIIMLFVSAVFSGAELENAFRHVFDLVWSQDPESFPFRQPVDPKLLGIPVRHLTRWYMP